jgi:rSAM/selenodomain-associated transferase 1
MSLRDGLILVLTAKPPVPGQVKTRFQPELTPEQAAALYRAFLQDTLTLMRSVPGVQYGLVFPRDGDRAAFGDLIPGDFWLRRQAAVGLTDTLGGTLTEALGRGHSGVIFLSSDSPSLPVTALEQAIGRLATHDVVIGPATDGGYYLIGLKQVVPALFERMPWSTPAVLGETLVRTRRAGLRVGCTPPWYDVDSFENLRFLAAHLAADQTLAAAATRRALSEVGLSFD